MTDLTTTSSTTKALYVLQSNDTGTSHLLVVSRSDWDPSRDLSLIDLTQAKAGMNAIAKYAAGGITGNPKLFFVAPTEKFLYDAGTGTMAYISSEYVPGRDDAEIEINGAKVSIGVDAKFIPEVGYARLMIDSGRLYRRSWEKAFLPEDTDAWTYWYCRSASQLLSGRNLSVSVGPKMIDMAEQIVAVCNAEDPAAANQARLYRGRETSRFQTEVRETRQELKVDCQEGVRTAVENSELNVPLAMGGTISLARYTMGQPIYLETASGSTLNARFLRSNNDLERLAIAQAIRKSGLKVVLK
jgi:hypothetical protein